MYLIRFEYPKQFAVSYRWSLVAMRHGGDGSLDPYVAFESVSDASGFINTLPTFHSYATIDSSCIGLDTQLRPNASAILFSSIEQLDAYRSGGMKQHIPRVPLPTWTHFEKIARGVKDWYASSRSRKLVNEG